MFSRIILFLSFLAANSQNIYVIDSDTFMYGSEKIRIKNIDGLEKQQPHGKIGTVILRNTLKQYKIKRIQREGRDRYGRTLASIWLEGNLRLDSILVVKGACMVYRRYCNDPTLIAAEKMARQQKKGIWKHHFINPEKFRHENIYSTFITNSYTRNLVHSNHYFRSF